MNASLKGDFVIRNVSVILVATKKTADCRSTKLSRWQISGIQELLREFQPGSLKGVALAKNLDVEKIIVNATVQVQSVANNANV